MQGGNADDRAVSYSAVYHALLQPMTGNDADGRYRGYDDGIHRADGWTYYEYSRCGIPTARRTSGWH